MAAVENDPAAWEDRFYLVMELVEGVTLRKVLTDFGSLSPVRALDVAAAVAAVTQGDVAVVALFTTFANAVAADGRLAVIGAIVVIDAVAVVALLARFGDAVAAENICGRGSRIGCGGSGRS